MKLAIDIVQSLLLRKLEKDASFDANQTNIAFWETFTSSLLDFEKDAKPVYAAIYSLELKDAEKIISKLDTVYISFIEELAENHVLGIGSEAIDYLITSKNSTFEKEVSFFTDLQNAITKVERKRIKTELPTSYDKLTFEVEEVVIANAIKKTSRDDLKKKMMNWDNELAEEKVPTINLTQNNQSKVISLYWVKYAVAACFVLGFGIWFYTNQTQGMLPDNNVVTTPDIKSPDDGSNVLPSIASEALAEVTSVTKTTPVIKEGFGFASKKNTIKIIENNQKARMASIVTAIEKYRQLLENEFSENKVGVNAKVKELETKLNSLQKELALLKEREKQYVFDGKSLLLYVSNTAKENTIVLYDSNYYLKKDTNYFKMTVSEKPQLYKKEVNTEVVNTLDKIIFDYGN